MYADINKNFDVRAKFLQVKAKGQLKNAKYRLIKLELVDHSQYQGIPYIN